MLKAGNLIKPADVPIVVINQVNPIYVNFAVPQQYWTDIKKNINEEELHVTATVPQDPEHPRRGTVIFADNAVDTTTGNLHIRASFANMDNQFLPGMFVNVQLRLSEQPNAKVVPAEAVTDGPNGKFVYVVKQDMTADMRPVVTSYTSGGESVIDSGLQRDEIVVRDGQSRLVPGAKVQIKNPNDVGLAESAAGTKAN
jgi:multidrug efflux system membrane fusion protein